MKNIYNSNDVEICKKDLCIKARGENGRMLSEAFAFTLICVGLAILLK